MAHKETEPVGDVQPAGSPDRERTDDAPAVLTDRQRAALKRRAAEDAAEPGPGGVLDASVQAHLDALAAERRGFVERGDVASAALVDEQIQHYGGTPPNGKDER